MQQNAPWDKGLAKSKAEKKLRGELVKIFKKNCKDQNYSDWYKHLKNVIQDEQVGDLRGFGYRIFMTWMKDERERASSRLAQVLCGVFSTMSKFGRGNKLER